MRGIGFSRLCAFAAHMLCKIYYGPHNIGKEVRSMFPNPFFPEIHGKLAFGCMRLPFQGDYVDIDQFKAMVDAFLDAGFNYFDTAHGYLGGQSETALREGLTSRYPREKYLLTNKLSDGFFHSEAEIRPLFETQLACCGVDYFDFYLMHAQNRNNFQKYKACRAYETAFALKEEGKIRHVGLSFHDTPDILDQILTEYPQIEVVQIQFNYLDYEDEAVQSKACYEVCAKHGKPVLIMEPVKGGNLVNLPPKGQEAIDECNAQLGTSFSNASYAIRFAAGFPQVACVLSGMSNMEQMEDNIKTMRHFDPLNLTETGAIAKVVDSYRSLGLIACTSCHYCVLENHCPKEIPIPELFACYNAKAAFHEWNQNMYYAIKTREGGKASDCIRCGGCERACPQHLPVRELLEKVAEEFEKR